MADTTTTADTETERYHYTPGSDGCDATFDVWGPDGRYVVSVRYWDRREWAEGEARKIVDLLNEHLPPEWVEVTGEERKRVVAASWAMEASPPVPAEDTGDDDATGWGIDDSSEPLATPTAAELLAALLALLPYARNEIGFINLRDSGSGVDRAATAAANAALSHAYELIAEARGTDVAIAAGAGRAAA